MRWSDKEVEVLVLGDSPVVVQLTSGGQETIVQHRQEHIAPELRHRYRERLADGSGYDSEHREILAEIQRREAAVRNRSGGYYIAEAEPDAALRCTRRTYLENTVKLCLIATDGAVPAIESGSIFGSPTPLLSVLLEIQKWERIQDPSGSIRPRSKIHDDKTLAILRSMTTRGG